MSNRQERHIELALPSGQMLVNNAVCVLRKRSIACEENGMVLGKQEIHVGRRSPPVDTIPASIVLRWRRLDAEATNVHTFVWR
jgi:hypothetical protein